MKQTTKMATKEMWEQAGNDRNKIIALAKMAPVFAIDDIPEMQGVEFGEPVLRGQEELQKFFHRVGVGRPKSADPKQVVSIRIPKSLVEKVRATGPGWQTRISEYLVRGIRRGDVGNTP